jgi:hypothetical protein
VRERDGQRLLFVLNRTDEVTQISLSEHAGMRDLLRHAPASGVLTLPARDVAILGPES